jgi:anthranilate synthase/aminodeoxychorismate synthase-like glutamine amidotransferase
MILIIDNYDSFAYNLYQYLGELGAAPAVYRNDALTCDDIARLRPSHIIISPGPCTPLETGISNEVIGCFAGHIPILGVCLGHQCIAHVFGAGIIPAVLPTHGKDSAIYHDGKSVYRNLPSPFDGGRYHSLTVAEEGVPDILKITARTKDGVIMGLRHRDYVVEGLQFHPESIMTRVGHALLENFIRINNPCWTEAI